MRKQDRNGVQNLLRRWLFDHVEAKHDLFAANGLNLPAWKDTTQSELIPYQGHGGSCGISVMFAIESIIKKKKLNFDIRDTDGYLEETSCIIFTTRIADSLNGWRCFCCKWAENVLSPLQELDEGNFSLCSVPIFVWWFESLPRAALSSRCDSNCLKYNRIEYNIIWNNYVIS